MKLQVTALNSGSNGNCYYIGNNREAVLIDAGISCREIERRMKRLGLYMQMVKAIFITHEHSDHVRGVRVLAKKYKLPVYLTHGTLKNSRQLDQDFPFYKAIIPFNEVKVGSLSITSFPKHHDAKDPQSYIVSCNDIYVGVLTDIGQTCQNVKHYFNKCQAVFLEANYCDDMLLKGKYPWYLKKRISSELGHLSNRQALELFQQHRGPGLSHVFLSHISAENNNPDLVYRMFSEMAEDVKIVVASRTSEIPVFEVGNNVTESSKFLVPE